MRYGLSDRSISELRLLFFIWILQLFSSSRHCLSVYNMIYPAVYLVLICFVVDGVGMVSSRGIIGYSHKYEVGYRLVYIFWLALRWR